MGRVLPNIAVAEMLENLGVPVDAFKEDFNDIMLKGLERLYAFQKADGGWGWFENDETDPFMTAYVVYGLARARDAWFHVDESKLLLGIECLRRMAETEEDMNRLAYLVFALSVADPAKSGARTSHRIQQSDAWLAGGTADGRAAVGIPDSIPAILGTPPDSGATGSSSGEEASPIDRLVSAQSDLTSYAQALLCQALCNMQQQDEAGHVAQELEKRALRGDGRTHWETKQWYYKWEKADIETTAYALKALLSLSPDAEYLPEVVDWLMSMRNGNRWRSTKDTASVILALVEYVRLRGEDMGLVVSAAGAKEEKGGERPRWIRRGTVTLNGSTSSEVSLDLNNPTRSVFSCHFRGDSLRAGGNKISFELDGDGGDMEFEACAALTYVDESGPPIAESVGLCVSATYDTPPDELRLFGETEVTLSIEADADYDFVIVSSPIPAGCEVIRGSGQGEFARFEERYDRALFFIRQMPKGQHAYAYRIRCLFAGEYGVAAPTASLMYNDDMRGAGMPIRVRISK